MARPKKDNADYFSHDAGMRNHRKIKALRTKFWHEWFSLWIMLLEHLCSCDHFLAKFDDVEKEILAGDFSADCGRLNDVVEFLLQIGLLQKEWEFIKSQSMIDRMTPMIEKRERERNKFLPQKLTETTQSKVKEIKVNEIKEKENTKDPEISFREKCRAVETKWKFLVGKRNRIMERNDLLDEKTQRNFLNFIYDIDNDDFGKRMEKHLEVSKLIIEKNLWKYLYRNPSEFSIGQFLENINIYQNSAQDIIKSFTNKDFVQKVTRMTTVSKVEIVEWQTEQPNELTHDQEEEIKQKKRDLLLKLKMKTWTKTE